MKFTALFKKILIDKINSVAIDVEELESFVNNGRPDQNFARFPEPEDIDWDTDEEYKVQGEKLIRDIRDDGLWELTNIPDELTEKAIEFIKKETGAEE